MSSEFSYASVRDPKGGACVGLYTPKAFAGKKPKTTAQWLCETRADGVAFKSYLSREVVSFALGDFLVDGVLPVPA